MNPAFLSSPTFTSRLPSTLPSQASVTSLTKPWLGAPRQNRSSNLPTSLNSIKRNTLSMTIAPEATRQQVQLDDLVELLVPTSQKSSKLQSAKSLVKVPLNDLDMQWLHVLSEGWASPLRGFMREKEYLQTLHFNCIRDERSRPPKLVNQSVPIVLTITEDQKAQISNGDDIALTEGKDGEIVGILRNVEVYAHNKEERVARSLGITDGRHPYAEIIYNSGDYIVGGDLEVLKEVKYGDGLDQYRMSPRQLREEYRKREADAIFFFQLRNPIHNGHALLMTSCREELLARGYKKPLLVVHQIGGKVKGDDVPLEYRIKQNKAVLAEGVLDPESTVLAIFPSPMLYGGPTEVQWHAKARMNAGCQFYIVGRDPAGMKHPNGERDMFDPWHGKTVLSLAPGLEKLEILPFRVAAYDKTKSKMAFFDPARKDDFLFISGTKMRGFAKNGETPPDGFMAPSAWKVLVDFYAGKK